MIQIIKESSKEWKVSFHLKEATYCMPGRLEIGMGTMVLKERLQIKELFAKAAKEMKQYKIKEASIDITSFIADFNVEVIKEIVEGIMLGMYEQEKFPAVSENYEIDLTGVAEGDVQEAEEILKASENLVEGIIFARDMVNRPGNKLRPLEFAGQIQTLLKDLPVTTEIIGLKQLQEMGMNGLVSIGSSSAYEPCLMILRYLPLGEPAEKMGLVGKGVTCDTGGYCLKPAGSMLGIKGDMAGGAAVAGAIYALAKNQIQQNVVGLIPMCENRISSGSLLPGDVYTAYDGTTVEVLNTDAEGRLILADTVAYAVQEEGVDRILDIATLTGAVVNLLGFSIGGVLSNDEKLYKDFEAAFEISGERYLRIPFYKEHEKMIESKIADVKNIGEAYCGTITAGLFIKKFVKDKPWIHLDIAGTAWVDQPVFEFQSKGATGAGVTSLYYLCCQRG